MFHKMTPRQWKEVIDTNLTGLFNMTHPLWAGMRDRKFGRVINISSINGQKGQAGQANYSAAKSGDLGFTKALAQEGARAGITVNAICPGYIGTEMVRAIDEKVLNERIIPQIPVGRLGEPEEIARIVVFLASRRRRLHHRLDDLRQRRAVLRLTRNGYLQRGGACGPAFSLAIRRMTRARATLIGFTADPDVVASGAADGRKRARPAVPADRDLLCHRRRRSAWSGSCASGEGRALRTVRLAVYAFGTVGAVRLSLPVFHGPPHGAGGRGGADRLPLAALHRAAVRPASGRDD